FTVQNAALGQSLIITEVLPDGWKLTDATCLRDGATVGSLVDDSYTIPGASVVSGALFECDFTNEATADLTIRKTNTPADGPDDLDGDVLLSGERTTYELLVGNEGPAAVSDAKLADLAQPHLSDCQLEAPACTVTSGTATCPTVGAAAGQLSIANLQDPDPITGG